MSRADDDFEGLGTITAIGCGVAGYIGGVMFTIFAALVYYFWMH